MVMQIIINELSNQSNSLLFGRCQKARAIVPIFFWKKPKKGFPRLSLTQKVIAKYL